jgi:hypothetical protein
VAYAWAACLASAVSGDLRTMRVPGLVIASMPICSGLCTPPYHGREIVAECFDVEVEFWKASGLFPLLCEDALQFNHKIEAYVRSHRADYL